MINLIYKDFKQSQIINIYRLIIHVKIRPQKINNQYTSS